MISLYELTLDYHNVIEVKSIEEVRNVCNLYQNMGIVCDGGLTHDRIEEYLTLGELLIIAFTDESRLKFGVFRAVDMLSDDIMYKYEHIIDVNKGISPDALMDILKED